MVKILLATDFSNGFSRALLRGVIRYVHNKPDWTLYRMPKYYKMVHGENEVLKWAKRWNVDAIIAQIDELDLDELKNLNIPIVIQNNKKRIPGVVNLTGDYMALGAMAAEYFMGMGYENFAYYGTGRTVWSRERYEGYIRRLESAGHSVYTFWEENDNMEEWVHNIEAIGSWLKSLPKNTAIFACNDYHALRISETCRFIGIAVPDEIAILGVDNDELLCNISTPPLSSMVIDAEKGGYVVGKVIDEMLADPEKEPFNIILPPQQIITRESTKKYVVHDKYVAAAIDYIEKNYFTKITVSDILEMVPISRRVFERRFKAAVGYSIYSFICNYRVEKMAELLLTTERSIEDVAISCGFENGRNISRVFSNIKGMTPSEFRGHSLSQKAK
jgi:LacI family transcriptional regulator